MLTCWHVINVKETLKSDIIYFNFHLKKKLNIKIMIQLKRCVIKYGNKKWEKFFILFNNKYR